MNQQNSSKDDASDIHLAAAILSKRYEDQLLKQGIAQNRVVPALVITGFLGSGKTTLLQHLLATVGNTLKLGVLVNEVAHLDVDSQLLNTTNSNAAAGIKAAQLSGGCACCAVSDDLSAALAELATSINYQQLDYLLLETSGVADAEPLAASLSAAGFRLTAVVAVVEAEAGPQLLQEQVAQAQLRAADIVVVNKCDLASLAGVSAVEDQVQLLAPHVRMLRARYGQVPAEALLDVNVETGAHAEEAVEQATEAACCAQGEIAFLSHEAIVSTVTFRPKKSAAVLRRPASSVRLGQQQQHHHLDHSSFGSVSFTSSEPLCMACFQTMVAQRLVPSTGLFRAKGFVWFQQQRAKRYVFHFSGKQRAQCGCEGPWSGPPGVQLVLIGQHQEALQQLQRSLQQCVANRCQCSKASSSCSMGDACMAVVTANDVHTAMQQGSILNKVVDHVCQLVDQHPRFKVVDSNQLQPPQDHDSSNIGGAAAGERSAEPSRVIRFTTVGSPLHGVLSDEVNAAVLRIVNATRGLFLCHTASPASLQSSTGQVAYQGVAELEVCMSVATVPKDAEAWWNTVHTVVDPILKKMYQHVHNCNCDVATTTT